MSKYSYPSVICRYCRYTDYGCQPVGTGHWNMCEGVYCEEAYNLYKVENPDDDSKLEELF